MDIEKILKLIDAGFSKDEIMKLAEPKKVDVSTETPKKVDVSTETPKKVDVSTEAPKPENKEAKAPEPEKPEPKEDYKKEITDAISEAFKPFEDLYNNLSKLSGMPSIHDVQPKGIEDIISDFFKGE